MIDTENVMILVKNWMTEARMRRKKMRFGKRLKRDTGNSISVYNMLRKHLPEVQTAPQTGQFCGAVL
jgi:hypothetical protein